MSNEMTAMSKRIKLDKMWKDLFKQAKILDSVDNPEAATGQPQSGREKYLVQSRRPCESGDVGDLSLLMKELEGFDLMGQVDAPALPVEPSQNTTVKIETPSVPATPIHKPAIKAEVKTSPPVIEKKEQSVQAPPQLAPIAQAKPVTVEKVKPVEEIKVYKPPVEEIKVYKPATEDIKVYKPPVEEIKVYKPVEPGPVKEIEQSVDTSSISAPEPAVAIVTGEQVKPVEDIKTYKPVEPEPARNAEVEVKKPMPEGEKAPNMELDDIMNGYMASVDQFISRNKNIHQGKKNHLTVQNKEASIGTAV